MVLTATQGKSKRSKGFTETIRLDRKSLFDPV